MDVTTVVAAIALLMIGVERIWPGSHLPVRDGFWMRAWVASAVQAGCVFMAGALWDGPMQAHRHRALDGLGVIGGAAVGYLVVTFVYYFWHRARHASPLLWRLFHQLHHSPARIEVVTSFYKHPLEMLINGVLSSAILYLGCGLGPEAASLAVLATGLAELFYHWNVRTPYWLGYLVQRPESHRVHHERGRHGGNFSDLPLWDMLFGTFHNPRPGHVVECGFEPARERRLVAMLAGRRVS